MKKCGFPLLLVCSIATLATPVFAGVSVSAPTNNSTVATTVQYVASATTSCSKGVSAMGIYTAPGVLAYTVKGASLNTLLNLSPNTTYNTVIQEWDNCGGSSSTPVTIKVGGSTGSSNVNVSAPANNSTVSTSVQYVATATTSCSKGVAAIGIYTAPYKLAYTVKGASLNTSLSLSSGTYNTVVQEWDNCGNSAKTPITITVGSGNNPQQHTFANLHQQNGWTGYALLPVSYAICGSCTSGGPQLTWSRTTGVSSPSMSGSATRHDIGGKTQYADALWNNHLIGDFSSQNLPDWNHTIVPTVHNFTYDVWFYATNIALSQALEFDINQFFSGQSFIWGHECRIAGGHQWDVWDNPAQKWHATGIPCNPVNGWNHLVLQVQRTSGNQLLFQSISLNGQTANPNYTSSPTPTSWYGITINYQQDGNYAQQPYSIWLDKLNFTYW
jgi:hypothetical protein